MDPGELTQIRRFNRLVTQRIGALQSAYLTRDRPLGESRILWEIGNGITHVRELRARLDLDSGYVSRILRSLERAGLVIVDHDESDNRARVARTTPAGDAECALLDNRSDELAASIVEPLTTTQRHRLITAMGEVETLLTAAMIRIEIADPSSRDARHCLMAYADELHRRFEAGFDPAQSISAEPEELRLPQGLLLVASLHHEPVGCGALKLHDDAPAEIKRMWVDSTVRGLGLGRRLLGELERHAAAHGSNVVRLETNRCLTEAITLYRSSGYTEVQAFNDEPYAHHWFEKDLR